MARKKIDPEFKAHMSTLHRDIVRAHLCGDISEDSFILGMHILARMAHQGEYTVAFTIADTWATSVVRKGMLVSYAQLGKKIAFEFDVHAALQECQVNFGIGIERSPEALEELVAAAQAEDCIPDNFTSFPGDVDTDEWNYVDKNTTLHCRYLPWASLPWDKVTEGLLEDPARKVLSLPRWVTAVEV